MSICMYFYLVSYIKWFIGFYHLCYDVDHLVFLILYAKLSCYYDLFVFMVVSFLIQNSIILKIVDNLALLTIVFRSHDLISHIVFVSVMPIDPEKGFHKGTLISCILSVIGQAINNCLILPSLPFLIKMYYPDVIEYCLSLH